MKNERLGIVQTVRVSASTEPNTLTKHTQDQIEADFYYGADYNTTAGLPLTAPEYQPSADDILDVLADHYVQDKQTISGWLCKMNFDAIPLSEGNQ